MSLETRPECEGASAEARLDINTAAGRLVIQSLDPGIYLVLQTSMPREESWVPVGNNGEKVQTYTFGQLSGWVAAHSQEDGLDGASDGAPVQVDMVFRKEILALGAAAAGALASRLAGAPLVNGNEDVGRIAHLLQEVVQSDSPEVRARVMQCLPERHIEVCMVFKDFDSSKPDDAGPMFAIQTPNRSYVPCTPPAAVAPAIEQALPQFAAA